MSQGPLPELRGSLPWAYSPDDGMSMLTGRPHAGEALVVLDEPGDGK